MNNNTLRGLIFCIALSVALAQFEVCEDLVDGATAAGAFSDPTYANGQSFGRFFYNFTTIDGTNNTNEYPFEGFVWPWRSREYSNGNALGGHVPLFFPNDLLWNFPAASFNGWEWSNNYLNGDGEMRTCGLDNETFTDGPGTMSSDNSWWGTFAYPIYNLTFWQKAYVPSAPTANWARVVHYIHNPGAESIFMNYHATSYPNDVIFSNRGSNDRFVVMSNIDQGVAFSYVPVAINHMGQNSRLRVSQGYSLDCYAIGYSSYFELAPAQTVGIMMVYSLGMNISHVLDTAKWIDTNPPEIFAKMSTEDISTIMNWDACAAAHGSEVSIQITQPDKCSSSAAKMDISTTGTTLTGDITHRVLNAAGEVVASNVTESVTLNQAGAYLLESWWNGCVVKRTSFSAVFNDAAWNSVTGEFNGSNGPFKFVAGSANFITIYDKNNCSVIGTFGSASNTPVSTTPAKKSSADMIVPSIVFSAAALAFLF